MSANSYIYVREGMQTTKPKGCTMTNEYMDYGEFIKSQPQNAIFKHPDVQQKMLMMMGQNTDKKLEITPAEQKKIAQCYQRMYFSIATIHWCNGETLGVARQKSLQQMNNYVKQKVNIAHPINKYLMAINGQMHREIAQMNMTDKNSDNKVEIGPELKKKWTEASTKQFHESLKTLNEIHKKYMPTQEMKKTPSVKAFDIANKKAMDLMRQMAIIQQMQRQAG